MKIKNLPFAICHLRAKRPGLSLIELLIGVAIFGAVSILFVTIVLINSRLFSDQKTSIHIASQNRLALDEITNQIRESAGVVDTCSGCGSSSSGISTLVLAVWPLDINGQPYQPTSMCIFDYIIYTRDTDELEITKEIIVPDQTNSSRKPSAKILASDATNLTFDYDDLGNPANTTEVTISVENVASSIHKTHTVSQDTKASLRTIAQPVVNNNGIIYAIHSGNSDSELRIGSSSQIVGDIHSNYTICTIDNCPATPTVTINGNVSAVDNIADGVNVAAPYTKTEGAPFVPLPSINHYDWVNEADAGANMGTTNWSGGTRELGPAKITGNLTLSNNIDLTLNGPVHITGNLILNGGTGGNMAKIRLNEALGSQGTAIVVDGSMGTFSTGGTFKNVTIYPTSSNPKGFLFLVSTKTGTSSELMPAENVQGHAVYLSRGNAYIGVYSTTNLTGALIGGRVGTSGAITYDDDLAEFSSSGSGAESCVP